MQREMNSINLIQTNNNLQTLNNNADKIQILTILPKSWSASKRCSKYLAEEAKKLQMSHGIPAPPENKEYILTNV